MNTIPNLTTPQGILESIRQANTRLDDLIMRSRLWLILKINQSKTYSKEQHDFIENEIEQEKKMISKLQSILRATAPQAA